MRQFLILLACIAAVVTGFYIYGYFLYGIEGSKDMMLQLLEPYIGEISDFDKHKYYYMGAFLGPFVTLFALMQARVLHPGYLFLFGSFVFLGAALDWNADTITIKSYSFIIPALAFMGVFFFLTIIPQIAKRKNLYLKKYGLQVKAQYVNTISNHGFRMNGRPQRKVVAQAIHPQTGETIMVESPGSFDPYAFLNVSEELQVYFDPQDPESYFLEV